MDCSRTKMKTNLDVEIARLFGLVCVVAAHTNSVGAFYNFQTTGFVIDELCRASVQIFFLVSGFFWKPDQIVAQWDYLKRLFPKLAIPFVIWAAIYLSLDATQLLYASPDPRTWRSYVTTPWSGGIAFHLWFLPALFVGTAISMSLINLAGLKRAMMAVLGLFLIGVVLGSYLRPFGISMPLSVYRNGIFFAPIFLMAGYYLKTMKTLPSLATFTAITIFGCALNMLEGIYIVRSFPNGHDLSLGTLPFGIGAFGMFLHLKSTSANLAGWGREVFGAYLVHVLIMKVLIEHVQPSNSLVLLTFCIIATILLSLVFSRLVKKSRWLRYLAP